MGRITVFTEDNCEQCEWAREVLDMLAIPFVEINVSRDPDRRSDMISLTNDLMVPRVFFNEKYIGGASQLYKTLQDWSEDSGAAGHYETPRERYQYEIAPLAEPSDRRLRVGKRSVSSTRSHKAVKDNFNKSTLIKISEGNYIPIGQLTTQLVSYMPRHAIKQGRKVYRNCFRGSQALDAWIDIFDIQSKEAAVALGITLMHHGILHNLIERNSKYLFDSANIFQLQPFHEPEVLNNHIVWKSETGSGGGRPDPAATILNLAQLMERIVGLLDNDETISSIQSHKLYEQFTEEACVLQSIHLPNSNNTAMRLNLANLMMRHYVLEWERRGIDNAWPEQKKDVPVFLSKICYNVGGKKINLRRLTLQLLRGGNSCGWQQEWLSPLFCISGCAPDILNRPAIDPRLRFCLSWGMKSSPPVRIYHEESLEQELQVAAQQYCNKHVAFDQKQGFFILPKMFKWNKVDFGAGPAKVAEKLSRYLSRSQLATLERTQQKHKGKVKILYHSYDWEPSLRPSMKRQLVATPKPKEASPPATINTRLQEIFNDNARPQNTNPAPRKVSAGTVGSDTLYVGDENSTSFHGGNSALSYRPSRMNEDNSILFHEDDSTWIGASDMGGSDDFSVIPGGLDDDTSTWYRPSDMKGSDDFSALPGGLDDDSFSWYRPSDLKRPENFVQVAPNAVQRGQDTSNPPIRPFHRKMDSDSKSDHPLTETSSGSTESDFDDYSTSLGPPAPIQDDDNGDDDFSEFESVIHKGTDLLNLSEGDDATWATYSQIGDDATRATPTSRAFSGAGATWATYKDDGATWAIRSREFNGSTWATYSHY